MASHVASQSLHLRNIVEHFFLILKMIFAKITAKGPCNDMKKCTTLNGL